MLIVFFLAGKRIFLNSLAVCGPYEDINKLHLKNIEFILCVRSHMPSIAVYTKLCIFPFCSDFAKLRFFSVYPRYIVMAFLLRPMANHETVDHQERRGVESETAQVTPRTSINNAQDAVTATFPIMHKTDTLANFSKRTVCRGPGACREIVIWPYGGWGLGVCLDTNFTMKGLIKNVFTQMLALMRRIVALNNHIYAIRHK